MNTTTATRLLAAFALLSAISSIGQAARSISNPLAPVNAALEQRS